MRSIILQHSKPKQIRKNLNLLPNSPEFNKYVEGMENDSKSFWSSPSPHNSFQRYRLGSAMLPPFSSPPDENIHNFFNNNNTQNKINSVKIETDYANSIKISLEENDDMIFTLDD